MIDRRRHPPQVVVGAGCEVTAAEVDRLSREIERQKVGDSLSVRVAPNYLALDKRLRSAAPAKVSRASSPRIQRLRAAGNAGVTASVVGEGVSISASTPTAIARR